MFAFARSLSIPASQDELGKAQSKNEMCYSPCKSLPTSLSLYSWGAAFQCPSPEQGKSLLSSSSCQALDSTA